MVRLDLFDPSVDAYKQDFSRRAAGYRHLSDDVDDDQQRKERQLLVLRVGGVFLVLCGVTLWIVLVRSTPPEPTATSFGNTDWKPLFWFVFLIFLSFPFCLWLSGVCQDCINMWRGDDEDRFDDLVGTDNCQEGQSQLWRVDTV